MCQQNECVYVFGGETRWFSHKNLLIPRLNVKVKKFQLKKGVCRKERMVGEHAEDAGLIIVEEVRRCMFEALDRFEIKAENYLKD